jgi:hypothetical protein
MAKTTVDLSMADPAGNIRHETDASFSIEILNDESNHDPDIMRAPLNLGFVTEPAPSNNPVRRQDAVRHYLTKMVDGEPGLLIDKKCKIVRKGFRGGYRYRKLQVSGDTRYSDKPEKNEFSHPHDAVQYLALGCLEGYLGSESGTDRWGDTEEITIDTSYIV